MLLLGNRNIGSFTYTLLDSSTPHVLIYIAPMGQLLNTSAIYESHKLISSCLIERICLSSIVKFQNFALLGQKH